MYYIIMKVKFMQVVEKNYLKKFKLGNHDSIQVFYRPILFLKTKIQGLKLSLLSQAPIGYICF